MKTLLQILGGRNLTGVIQGVKTGLPDVVPPAFLTATRTVEGNTGSYFKVNGTRQTARIVQYGSPSERRAQRGVTEVPIRLIHTFEHINHLPATLINLQSMESEAKQRLGEEEVARQTREFSALFENLRKAAIQSAIALGHVYVDAEGNLLASAVGAAYEIDFGVPADNLGQLDGLIDGSWDDPDTDIVGQVEALKRTSLLNTGYPLAYAFYGENIPGYLFNNTTLAGVINGNPAYANAVGQGTIPQGFLGFTWISAAAFGFTDNDGVVQTLFPADQVTFTPAPSADWWDLIEGTYPVPDTLGLGGSTGEAALMNISLAKGMFSYAEITADPVGVKHMAGDTFLPVIKVPGAVFIADTCFVAPTTTTEAATTTTAA